MHQVRYKVEPLLHMVQLNFEFRIRYYTVPRIVLLEVHMCQLVLSIDHMQVGYMHQVKFKATGINQLVVHSLLMY